MKGEVQNGMVHILAELVYKPEVLMEDENGLAHVICYAVTATTECHSGIRDICFLLHSTSLLKSNLISSEKGLSITKQSSQGSVVSSGIVLRVGSSGFDSRWGHWIFQLT
jgi:hypothetical protein